MRKTFLFPLSAMISLSIIGVPATLSSIVFADAQAMRPLPAMPMQTAQAASSSRSEETSISSASAPVRLIIPSLNMNVAIEGLGVNGKGEMAVPSGKTNNVGWYKYGTKPGDPGTAVLDAHVFAAFSSLKYLKPGDDIYVVTATDQTLHFIVAAAKTYALRALSSEELFSGMGPQAMNLITCAGSLTRDRSTYDHRLVVYTTLASS